MTSPAMDRFRPPSPESLADEARNEIQGSEQELERLRSRLESNLEAAIVGLGDRDYAGVIMELEGVADMADRLDAMEETLIERRQNMEPRER